MVGGRADMCLRGDSRSRDRSAGFAVNHQEAAHQEYWRIGARPGAMGEGKAVPAQLHWRQSQLEQTEPLVSLVKAFSEKTLSTSGTPCPFSIHFANATLKRTPGTRKLVLVPVTSSSAAPTQGEKRRHGRQAVDAGARGCDPVSEVSDRASGCGGQRGGGLETLVGSAKGRWAGKDARLLGRPATRAEGANGGRDQRGEPGTAAPRQAGACPFRKGYQGQEQDAGKGPRECACSGSAEAAACGRCDRFRWRGDEGSTQERIRPRDGRVA